MKIPAHLRPYCVTQNYAHYTPVNQAVWRYVMRQFMAFFRDKAHPIYYNGLQSSGITVDAIPNIETMNELMARFGWSAVVVDGLVPTSVFMDFQAHQILPISVDIRTLDHLGYTPAPDIIHETAGHAPILVDPDYSAFVQRFGEIGAKAFSSNADREVYQATRELSIIKESPTATPEAVAAAEANLVAKKAAVVEPSEETLAGRLYWWTVEYGLIGTLEAPRLYGAGLLSSVMESRICLTDKVEKLPFSLEACLATNFDITTYQPQLFVCESFEQLLEAVNAFEATMAHRLGGTVALDRALASAATATVELTSGLQVTGTLTTLLKDVAGEGIYFRMEGPSALALENEEVHGHGRDYHADGYRVPIGRLEGESVGIEDFQPADLKRWNLEPSRMTRLTFASGLVVAGAVAYVRRHGEKVVMIGLEGATVSYAGQTLYKSFSDIYPMPVGAAVASAYAGAADKAAFYGASEGPLPEKSLLYTKSPEEERLHGLYATVRVVRERKPEPNELTAALAPVLVALDADYPEDWLLRLELLELLESRELASEWRDRLRDQLAALRTTPEQTKLIDDGMALIGPARVSP